MNILYFRIIYNKPDGSKDTFGVCFKAMTLKDDISFRLGEFKLIRI